MKDLPSFYGDHELVAPLNRMVDCIRERTLLDGSAYQVSSFPFGQRANFRLPPAGSTSGVVEQFLVIEEHRDHVVCQRANFDTQGIATLSGEAVRIAKPDEIRMRGWDTTGLGLAYEIGGYQYTYTQNGTETDLAQNPWNRRTARLMDASEYGTDTISFQEEVWPPYIGGKTTLYASRVAQSPIFSVTETEAVNGVPVATSHDIEWIDLTPRIWRLRFRKIRVCVEGQTGPWFVLVPASDSFQEE